jgi:transposase
VRVSTAFNTMLGIPGASVAGVEFTSTGVIVRLRRRRRKHVCPCGWKTWSHYDRSVRRWRHLDLGAVRCELEAEIVRIDCRRCGRVRTEVVPWARPSSRHTRDFQDVVCYLAQRTDKTTICRLMRTSFEAVAHVVQTVVHEELDDTRLDDLYRIGVDEVSYRKGHRYLTVVADHDRDGAVIWVGEGKDAKTLSRFYDELGPKRTACLEAVSLDMGGAYKKATDDKAPQARQCVDPFHLVKLCNEAIDKTRRWAWNVHRGAGLPSAVWVKRTRWALVKDPGDLKDSQLEILAELERRRSVLFRAWQLKEALRDLYRLEDPTEAGAHLDWWLAWAARCRIPAFVSFQKTVRSNRDRILGAVELGLSNSKLEGLNSKIRLINHRGYGHRSLPALIAMIYLCCGGITVTLPFERS